jgi:hypothetical protein
MWQAAEFAVGRTLFEEDVLTVDVADFTQSLTKLIETRIPAGDDVR